MSHPKKAMLQFLLCFILVTYSSASQFKHIFLLAGQSNMSGRGGVVNNTWDGIIPSQCRSNPAVLCLDAALAWVEAGEPLHRDIDATKICGVGPGMAFANGVLDKDSSIGVLGLVPCAVGGTNISEWAQGSFLYNQLVDRAGAAVRSGGTLRGLLWYQGESDTVMRKDAEHYKGRLEKFFLDLRADLLSPSLPIVQVALASGKGPYVERVREAQLGINLPNVQCVDAKGLPLEPDGLHLTTPAQGAEKINEEEGIVETKVETVDYQWPAGRSAEEEPNKEKVGVVHVSRPSDDTGAGAGGVLADAAAAVATKVQSAKDAISGIGTNNNNNNK